jgi:hypothetical protein
MKSLSKEDESKFTKAMYHSFKNLHAIEIIIWDVIKPWKRDIFLQAIKDGMAWKFAYLKAKKAKKI